MSAIVLAGGGACTVDVSVTGCSGDAELPQLLRLIAATANAATIDMDLQLTNFILYYFGQK
jgi:hypothetical protein